jgi:hypothetical protein
VGYILGDFLTNACGHPAPGICFAAVRSLSITIVSVNCKAAVFAQMHCLDQSHHMYMYVCMYICAIHLCANSNFTVYTYNCNRQASHSRKSCTYVCTCVRKWLVHVLYMRKYIIERSILHRVCVL